MTKRSADGDWKHVQVLTRDYPELAEILHTEGSDEFSSIFDFLAVAQDPVLEGVADYVRAVRQAVAANFLAASDRDTLPLMLRREINVAQQTKERDE